MLRDATELFDRLVRRKSRRKAKRKIHSFVRRERKKKSLDEYGRHY